MHQRGRSKPAAASVVGFGSGGVAGAAGAAGAATEPTVVIDKEVIREGGERWVSR